jgi:hypothetical protein
MLKSKLSLSRHFEYANKQITQAKPKPMKKKLPPKKKIKIKWRSCDFT